MGSTLAWSDLVKPHSLHLQSGVLSPAHLRGHLLTYFTSFYFMCIRVWLACMYVHHVHAWCLQRSPDPVNLELQLVVRTGHGSDST